jgi:hypothetical protein
MEGYVASITNLLEVVLATMTVKAGHLVSRLIVAWLM